MESKKPESSPDLAAKDKDYFENDDDEEDLLGVKGDGRIKKQSSYTYWVQNNKEQFPQHQDKQMIAPKKIEDPELLKKLEDTAAKKGSAWNNAGTWYGIFTYLSDVIGRTRSSKWTSYRSISRIFAAGVSIRARN